MNCILQRTVVALAAAGFGASALSQDAARMVIDTPAGGWRASDSTQRDFVQTVNCPASNVNAEGRSASALIVGRIAKGIAASTKTDGREPARLIVDGVALPLEMADDGRFARRWRAAPKLRVVLSWDTDMTDIDLHVVSPDGQHVWYGQRMAANGGALDVDVTTGFGP